MSIWSLPLKIQASVQVDSMEGIGLVDSIKNIEYH